MTRGLRSSTTALSAAHCSSPHSSAWFPPTAASTGLVERRASNTPPCDEPPSAMRSTHEPSPGSVRPVDEHLSNST